MVAIVIVSLATVTVETFDKPASSPQRHQGMAMTIAVPCLHRE